MSKLGTPINTHIEHIKQRGDFMAYLIIGVSIGLTSAWIIPTNHLLGTILLLIGMIIGFQGRKKVFGKGGKV